MNQWALSNDFLAALGSHCRLLTEFCIPHMQPQVFMSDEPLFECFFDGLGSDAVLSCWKEGRQAPLSFSRLKIVDMLYWNHSQRFIQTLARFYPGVRLREVDAFFFQGEPNGLAQPFLEMGAKIPAMGLTCQLTDITQERLSGLVKHMPYLREMRIQATCSSDLLVDPGDRIEEMEKVGVKLERLVKQMATFESLAVRHESLLGAVAMLRGSLRARGEGVTSLLLYCDMGKFEESAVYQLVNLCPRLCVLVVTVDLGEVQSVEGAR